MIELDDVMQELGRALSTVHDHAGINGHVVIERRAMEKLQHIHKMYIESFGDLKLHVEGNIITRMKGIRAVLSCGLRAAKHFADSREPLKFRDPYELDRAEKLLQGYGCTTRRE